MIFNFGISLMDLAQLSDNEYWQLWKIMGKIIQNRHPKKRTPLLPYYDSLAEYEVTMQARMG